MPALTAVLVSAALHAGWNYLLRRTGGNATVVALSKVAEALALTPIALAVVYSSGVPAVWPYLPLVLVAALLALANYLALTGAYQRGDLSLVYPVARGGVFLFLPLLGLVVFQERIGPTGWIALSLIVGGIMMSSLHGLDRAGMAALVTRLRSRAVALALVASASTAAYTIWDKVAVGHLDPFLYFYGYTLLLAVWFVAVLARTARSDVRLAWRTYPAAVVLIGLLNAAAYLLVLVALRDGMATQVLAVRQLSIPIGVLLGWRLLRESVPAPRAIGTALITGGCLLAAVL